VWGNLHDVPVATRAAVADDLLTGGDPSFWEVTDRQIPFDWVSPKQRPTVGQFLAHLPPAAEDTAGLRRLGVTSCPCGGDLSSPLASAARP
jgi:hypothetical protein